MSAIHPSARAILLSFTMQYSAIVSIGANGIAVKHKW